MNPVFVGGALGALAMYLLDPQSGRRRRARARDQLMHASRVLNDAGKVTARDAAHRAQGIAAGARKLFNREEVSDEALLGRVRAALGRVVSHPHAIEVAADGGHVTLGGPILAGEVRPLLRAVRAVPGVRAVADQLTVHQSAEHVSALQGGVPRSGRRFELLQDNWSPAARLAAGAAGAGMLAGALRARGGLCALLGVGGSALLARAATNMDVASLLGFGRRGIAVEKIVDLDAPVERVFGFWTDYQSFPRAMHNVREVRQIDGNRSRWVVAGPAGVPVHWDAEVTRIEPNALIEWRSTDGSDVRHEGEVRFEPRNGGTRVHVHLSYVPPGGALGHAVAALLGADPKSEMDADLLRMKTMIETGHAPHDAARRTG
ncbi:MAG TPA: SRPBCC family protein [Burkholderiales bacterium]|nr:SRPBCC family protein [Burkholderiales bacterium]